jgi:L-amino acid N-acyltransferase YncA
VPFVWDEHTLRNGTVFTLQTDLGAIDLLAEVAGVGTYKDAVAHSIIVNAFGRGIATLDLKSLIEAKRAAGRDKDLAGLAELESLLEAGQS